MFNGSSSAVQLSCPSVMPICSCPTAMSSCHAHLSSTAVIPSCHFHLSCSAVVPSCHLHLSCSAVILSCHFHLSCSAVIFSCHAQLLCPAVISSCHVHLSCPALILLKKKGDPHPVARQRIFPSLYSSMVFACPQPSRSQFLRCFRLNLTRSLFYSKGELVHGLKCLKYRLKKLVLKRF